MARWSRCDNHGGSAIVVGRIKVRSLLFLVVIIVVLTRLTLFHDTRRLFRYPKITGELSEKVTIELVYHVV